MRLEDKLRDHLETRVPRYPSHDVEIADVITRGKRLQWRARGAMAAMSVTGIAVFAAAAIMWTGTPRTNPDPATLLSEKSLYDQVLEGWNPVPDPVDPELAAVAVKLCDTEGMELENGMVLSDDLTLLVIDQRGISARVLLGEPTNDGVITFNCGVIEVDGVWRSAQEVGEELPSMTSGSGGPLPEYVADVRLRFADGTEVVASVGGGEYLFQHPSSLDPAGSYMEQYSAEGALVSSEMYMPPADYPQTSSFPSLVGLPLPDFDLVELRSGVDPSSAEEPRATVVVVWTPNCPFCAGQLIAVQKVADASGADVEILGIVSQATYEESDAMLTRLGITFPNGLDEGDLVHDALSIELVPMTFVANQDGVIVAQLAGKVTSDDLLKVIADALR